VTEEAKLHLLTFERGIRVIFLTVVANLFQHLVMYIQSAPFA
jgi:hypothetical protein